MKFQNVFPPALFAAFVVIPILIVPFDMWDGVMIQYASEKGDCRGLKIWFFEMNLFFSYPFFCTLSQIGHKLHLPYLTVNAIAVLLIGFVVFRETGLFARNELKLSAGYATFASALVATSPTFSTLLSSVITMYIFYLGTGLLAVRLIHESERAKIFAGVAILPVAFHYGALLTFLPVLSYGYDVLRRGVAHENWGCLPSTKTLTIFVVAVVCYVLPREFFPQSGLYEFYNQIGSGGAGVSLMVYGTIRFATYLLPLFIGVGLSFLALITLQKTQGIRFPNLEGTPVVLLLFGLFVATVIPYILVGKSANIKSVFGWEARHAIPAAVAVALICAAVFTRLQQAMATNFQRNVLAASASFLVIVNLCMLSYGVIYKLNRQIVLDEIRNAIASIEKPLPPGLVQIVGEGFPGPVIADHDATFLMYKATGRADLWARMGENVDLGWNVPGFIFQDEAYGVEYIYDRKMDDPMAETIIRVRIGSGVGLPHYYANLVRHVSGSKELSGIAVIDSIDIKEHIEERPRALYHDR